MASTRYSQRHGPLQTTRERAEGACQVPTGTPLPLPALERAHSLLYRMIPTPTYSHLSAKDFQDVYEPAGPSLHLSAWRTELIEAKGDQRTLSSSLMRWNRTRNCSRGALSASRLGPSALSPCSLPVLTKRAHKQVRKRLRVCFSRVDLRCFVVSSVPSISYLPHRPPLTSLAHSLPNNRPLAPRLPRHAPHRHRQRNSPPSNPDKPHYVAPTASQGRSGRASVQSAVCRDGG